MGIGAALMFPATLAILVNVFTGAEGAGQGDRRLGRDRRPRRRPRPGHRRLPARALLVGLGADDQRAGRSPSPSSPSPCVVPTSRDTTIAALRPARHGAVDRRHRHARVGRDRGPEHGWTSPTSVVAFGLAAAAARRRSSPGSATPTTRCSTSRVFTDMRFTAGSIAVTFAFFALFGFVFLVTQYFQFVRGYGTLEAGVRTVRSPSSPASTAPLVGQAGRAHRHQGRRHRRAGVDGRRVRHRRHDRSVDDAVLRSSSLAMFFLGGGLGLVQAPATEAIMGSLPPAKAGVGSAVNDTARELGGTLGVAIIGSVFSSIYASRARRRPRRLAGAGRRARPSPRSRSAPPTRSPSRPAPPPARRPRSSSAAPSTTPSSPAGTPGRGSRFGVVLLGAARRLALPARPGHASSPTTPRRSTLERRRADADAELMRR